MDSGLGGEQDVEHEDEEEEDGDASELLVVDSCAIILTTTRLDEPAHFHASLESAAQRLRPSNWVKPRRDGIQMETNIFFSREGWCWGMVVVIIVSIQ